MEENKGATSSEAERAKAISKSISSNFASIAKSFPDFSKIIPKIPNLGSIIEIPKIEIANIKSPFVTAEKNNWERHNDLMEIQDGILKINRALLKEQGSNSSMTKWVLFVAILTLFATVWALIIQII